MPGFCTSKRQRKIFRDKIFTQVSNKIWRRFSISPWTAERKNKYETNCPNILKMLMNVRSVKKDIVSKIKPSNFVLHYIYVKNARSNELKIKIFAFLIKMVNIQFCLINNK